MNDEWDDLGMLLAEKWNTPLPMKAQMIGSQNKINRYSIISRYVGFQTYVHMIAAHEYIQEYIHAVVATIICCWHMCNQIRCNADDKY